MTYNQEALDTAIYAGSILLKNGAEIYRVQDTIMKLLETFGVVDYNVYVISTAIIVSVGEKGENPCNCVRHIELGSVHLERIAAVNDLSRCVVAGKNRDMAAIREKLAECEAIPQKPKALAYFACAMGASCFCYILGGSVLDSLASFMTGILLQAYLFFSAKRKQNKFIITILGSLWAVLWSQIFYRIGLGTSLDNIIIGAIIPLVPGVAMVTCIRDFFNSDYLCGTIHLIDGVLTAASIAVGVSSMLGFWNLMTGVFA